MRSFAALLPAALLAATLGACGDLLEVTNPGAVEDEQLSDTLNAPLLANTVVSDFQYIYDDIARNSSWLSDEMVSGHNFVGFREWDGRIMKEERNELHSVYTYLHQARFSADTLVGRFIVNNPQPTPLENLAIARMKAYGGYSYVLLGELFCESPLRGDEAAVSSDEILRRGITRFEEAIAAATVPGGARGLAPFPGPRGRRARLPEPGRQGEGDPARLGGGGHLRLPHLLLRRQGRAGERLLRLQHRHQPEPGGGRHLP
jgi:hypothetical protein